MKELTFPLGTSSRVSSRASGVMSTLSSFSFTSPSMRSASEILKAFHLLVSMRGLIHCSQPLNTLLMFLTLAKKSTKMTHTLHSPSSFRSRKPSNFLLSAFAWNIDNEIIWDNIKPITRSHCESSTELWEKNRKPWMRRPFQWKRGRMSATLVALEQYIFWGIHCEHTKKVKRFEREKSERNRE